MARLLADSWAYSVHLHSDDFWHYIKRGQIAPYLPQAHQQNQTVIDALARAASAYAAGGYQVICDGIVGPCFIDAFRASATARSIPLHYVILRPDLATTLDRAVSRTSDALTDPEPVRSPHHQFSDISGLDEHILDSTQLTPEATADAVLRGLAGGHTASHHESRQPGRSAQRVARGYATAIVRHEDGRWLRWPG